VKNKKTAPTGPFSSPSLSHKITFHKPPHVPLHPQICSSSTKIITLPSRFQSAPGSMPSNGIVLQKHYHPPGHEIFLLQGEFATIGTLLPHLYHRAMLEDNGGKEKDDLLLDM